MQFVAIFEGMGFRENAVHSIAFGIRGVFVGAAGGLAYEVFSTQSPTWVHLGIFGLLAAAAALVDFTIRQSWEIDP